MGRKGIQLDIIIVVDESYKYYESLKISFLYNWLFVFEEKKLGE